MRTRRAAIFLIIVALAALAAVGRPLAILYTNDLHVRLDRLSSLREKIERERAADTPVLLVDAGDAWQDFRTPLAAVWGADRMVDWMNGVGYDAMALGNHEMYWGADRLAELAARASFPILCANLVPTPGISSPFVASAVRVVDGLRVLLVGLITGEHLPYPDFPWLRRVASVAALRGTLDAQTEAVDLVVVVGHLPTAEATAIARAVDSIDVFVSGHSHEETPEPIRAGETLIVQAGAFGRYLGRLVLDVKPDDVSLVSNDLIPTTKAPADVDRGLVQLTAVVLTLLATALVVLL